MLLQFIWAWVHCAETNMKADLLVICSCSLSSLAALQFALHLPANLCNPSAACAWTLDKGLHEQTLWLTGNPSAYQHEN